MDREVRPACLAAVRLAAGLLVVGLAAPASAHVTITPSTTAAGARAVLDVQRPSWLRRLGDHRGHHPDPRGDQRGHPDLECAVGAREGDRSWTRRDREPRGPGDRAGRAVTYRTDTPLSDGHRDVVALSVELPDAEGATLVFPTIQTCEQGEAAWIEVPEDGQDPEELVLPAPAIVVTAGSDARQTSATDGAGGGPSGGSQAGGRRSRCRSSPTPPSGRASSASCSASPAWPGCAAGRDRPLLAAGGGAARRARRHGCRRARQRRSGQCARHPGRDRSR